TWRFALTYHMWLRLTRHVECLTYHMWFCLNPCVEVVRDKRTNKTKGYGFVSFLDPMDFARAIREMDGKYIGNRPAKIRKSDWLKREDQPGGKKKGFNVKNSKKKIRTLS
ncbi:hypothetical protein CYMTET_12637, partial [Cymbomonas tetramitiformis]